MSALMELSGLSLMTTKICSSFSRLMKFPNQDFLASLGAEELVMSGNPYPGPDPPGPDSTALMLIPQPWASLTPPPSLACLGLGSAH